VPEADSITVQELAGLPFIDSPPLPIQVVHRRDKLFSAIQRDLMNAIEEDLRSTRAALAALGPWAAALLERDEVAPHALLVEGGAEVGQLGHVGVGDRLGRGRARLGHRHGHARERVQVERAHGRRP
jgi:hypothetical protein